MASSNKTRPSAPPVYTAPGAIAANITPKQQLMRSVMCCLLWENEAYEDGKEIKQRISTLAHQVSMEELAAIAIEVRTNMKLRHVPLLLARELARHPQRKNNPRLISETIAAVIQRADELSEFLALYWATNGGKKTLSKQIKLGLAQAFTKFNEYQLAKYNRKGKEVSLRDALFLSHAKPADVPKDAAEWTKMSRAQYGKLNEFAQQELVACLRPQGFTNGELLFGKLVHDQLETPDTWETQLSAGADKAATFRRLMAEGKLGDLAFLRNLRNMTQAGITMKEIEQYGNQLSWNHVLPFRFVAAAKTNPTFAGHLDVWMQSCLQQMPVLKGTTLLVVDTSGSMHAGLSSKSDLTRLSAAGALAALIRGVCEYPTIYATAGNDGYTRHATTEIPTYKGLALAEYFESGKLRAQIGGGGIFLTQCMDFIDHDQKGRVFDRVIVFTDEQDCDRKLNPANAKMLGKRNYLVNVASHKNGIGYKQWVHIDGFSEAVLSYIQAYEAL